MLDLRDFREHMGLTLTQFAELLGLSPSLVCRVELGREAPYPRFRRRAAEVLGIPESVLFRALDADGELLCRWRERKPAKVVKRA